MNRRILLTTDVVGGVWDFCLTLADGLRAGGDQVVLLALGSPSKAQHHAARLAGAQLISAPLKLEWMNDCDEDVRITRDLVREAAHQVGADVVHANQFAAARGEVDVPLVLTVHSDVLSWRKWTLGATETPPEWRSYVALVRDGLARADRVVAVSGFLADEVSSLYGVHRSIEVIHNGWPATGEAHEAARVGTVVAGRVWDAAKNIPLVAEAATGWQSGPVYLAGETTHPDGGHATIPSPMQPLGFLDRAELDTLLAQSRVYISAARYDPFGLLPLQAALHGCSLILSDIPSYREVWGDRATYFRANDTGDLRQQWRRVLEEEPSTRAQEYARAQLTPEKMTRNYRQIYASAKRAVAA